MTKAKRKIFSVASIAVAVNQKDTTPLDYEMYPSSIVDMTEWNICNSV